MGKYEASNPRAVSPKVTAAAAAGAIVTLAVWVAGLLGVEIPAEAQGALTTLIMVGAAYLIPDPAREVTYGVLPPGPGQPTPDQP